jgi:hypothetical protein
VRNWRGRVRDILAGDPPGGAGADPGAVGGGSYRDGMTVNGFAGVLRCGFVSRSNETVPQGAGNRFRPRMHVQFLVNRAEVKADGVDTDSEFPGGGLILMALRE